MCFDSQKTTTDPNQTELELAPEVGNEKSDDTFDASKFVILVMESSKVLDEDEVSEVLLSVSPTSEITALQANEISNKLLSKMTQKALAVAASHGLTAENDPRVAAIEEALASQLS